MDYSSPQDVGFFAAIAGVSLFVALILYVLMAIGLWKIFEKAGKPGWAGIIPIYNIFVLTEIVGRPIWFFFAILGGIILSMIPFLGILFSIGVAVLMFILLLDLSKSFGKDIAFTLGLFFLGFIFLPILGFGSAQYIGPSVTGPKEQTI